MYSRWAFPFIADRDVVRVAAGASTMPASCTAAGMVAVIKLNAGSVWDRSDHAANGHRRMVEYRLGAPGGPTVRWPISPADRPRA